MSNEVYATGSFRIVDRNNAITIYSRAEDTCREQLSRCGFDVEFDQYKQSNSHPGVGDTCVMHISQKEPATSIEPFFDTFHVVQYVEHRYPELLIFERENEDGEITWIHLLYEYNNYVSVAQTEPGVKEAPENLFR